MTASLAFCLSCQLALFPKQCLQVLPVSPDVLQLVFDRCTDLFCSTLFALCQIQVIFPCIVTVHARLVIIKPVTDIIYDGLKIFPGLIQNTDILWKSYLLWCTGCIKDQRPGIPTFGILFCWISITRCRIVWCIIPMIISLISHKTSTVRRLQHSTRNDGTNGGTA